MIYLGGDMLSIGQQMRREWEKQELQRLGFKVYAPQDDKDINDKANAKQDKLAERIVANDTEGMERSSIMIFDYLPHAQGTICEMGYAQHLKRASEKDIKIYVQCTDIRQGTGHISDEQDRAEFSINQYVYGVIMDITDGRGIQTFDEICEELIS
ncbi:nucleoside 2-deoxyribosyltransferase [Staphylococcus haemolyticus]|uniref:nucleoside 2-deoxyribosyltransferase n=1 Tax=Staphylococcus haemolyticus TaxID=1283 RepID=UPI00069DF20A|nr:nucleoside 2-deoxyribosyltransferase [Staphylococcus haemolyticus]